MVPYYQKDGNCTVKSIKQYLSDLKGFDKLDGNQNLTATEVKELLADNKL